VIVGPAACVNQALAMIDAEAFNAALLDISLNGEKSYPVADVLAARGVPFVLSTGHEKDRLPDDYQTFPMLQKPFSGAQLADMIAKPLMLEASFAEGEIAGGRTQLTLSLRRLSAAMTLPALSVGARKRSIVLR
jgi:DNA-binding NtrC family response regulator